MTDYVKITLTDGKNQIPMSVPKGSMISGQNNKTYSAENNCVIKMTKEQFKVATALAKLDNNGKDLDKDDFIKFQKMSKAQQSEFINKSLGKSNFKVGQLYSAVDDTTSGIVSNKDMLIVPMTPQGKTVNEENGNLFWMKI